MDNIILVDIDLSTPDFISGFESLSGDAIPILEQGSYLPFCFNFVNLFDDMLEFFTNKVLTKPKSNHYLEESFEEIDDNSIDSFSGKSCLSKCMD